jgi:hypothetical protein
MRKVNQMRKQTDRQWHVCKRYLLAVMVALSALTTLAWPAPSGAVRSAATTAPASACEGDACQQVTLTFEEAKQQYRAQNNSQDRWVKVTAANLAASAGACLGPGREAYLALKSMVEPYHAVYSPAGCGEQGAESEHRVVLR